MKIITKITTITTETTTIITTKTTIITTIITTKTTTDNILLTNFFNIYKMAIKLMVVNFIAIFR